MQKVEYQVRAGSRAQSRTSQNVAKACRRTNQRAATGIRQKLSKFCEQVLADDVVVTFTPHLIPMARGILSVSYLEPKGKVTQADLEGALVRILPGRVVCGSSPRNTLPQTAFVRGSNKAHIAVRLDERANRIVAFGAIDNLLKGAAGQAVQCMNVMMGYEETAGLPMAAAFP